MIVAIGILLAVVVAVVAAGAIGRARVLARVNRAAAQLGVHTLAPRVSLHDALERLDRGVTRQLAEHAEQPLAEQRLQLALDAMTQGAVVCDASGQIVARNAFAEAFVGARHGDALVGQALDELLESARLGEPAERELDLFGPPRRALLVSTLPLRSDDGTLVGAVALIDDVTEPQRLDAMRRDFVSNISHELKTPIGALALLAETMADEHDPDVLRHLAARLQCEAERLAVTVDDLLALSRIEHEDAPVREPVPVQQAIEEAVTRVQGAAEHREVPVSLTMTPGRLVVMADGRQLVSAIFNLIDNAVKYSEPGSPVTVRLRDTEGGIEIAVHDSGPGIPRRDVDRVFERFYRVDRARTRDTGGVGLGLAIVRHVATNHGGSVTVESVEGEGSTFTLTLPLTIVADDPAPNGEEPSQ